MEILNGRIKKVMGRGAKQTVDMGSSYPNHNNWRILWIILFSLVIGGCSIPKIKSSLTTGAATTAAVGVASVLAPSAIVPAVVGGGTAAIVSALSAAPSVKGEPIEVQAETFVQEAPDNFWTLLGKLTKLGGWALILIIIVPMLFSWLMPGPIQFKKGRKDK